jgi:transcriptional regulator with XRE-family HTH domain
MTPNPRPADHQPTAAPAVSSLTGHGMTNPTDHQRTAVPAHTADSHDAREQVRRLRAQGGTYRSIAGAAGLAPATVHDLASGHRSPTPSTTRALARVNSGSLRRARVDAGGTRLRLRALHVMGHGSARIARALGVRETTIRDIVRGNAPTVSSKLRDQVSDLYDAWWDKRAPERDRAERGAATAARRRAIAGNWCAGAGLDDDDLDTPGYKPASKWKPATGTGTAPDIHPPVRPRKDQDARRNPKGGRR